MSSTTASTQHKRPQKYIPGEIGVWMFVIGDMLVFTFFFCVFLFYRSFNIDLFNASQAALDQNLGAINTILLLTSSWFVVAAIESIRNDASKNGRKLFIGAFLCGAGFAVIKIFEFTEKVNSGITMGTNDFYMYYFFLTGVHFLHVIIGLGVLLALISKARASEFNDHDISIFESGGVYWHMVDLLWIVIFPLIYLVQ